MMLYLCFILLCLFTRVSATCYYPFDYKNCIFLDLGNNCNECTQDTVDIINIIPNNIGFTQYKGMCGCVVGIQTDCASWGIISGIIVRDGSLTVCSKTGENLIDAIINNQPCLNCANSASTPTPTSTLTPTQTSNSGCIADSNLQLLAILLFSVLHQLL